MARRCCCSQLRQGCRSYWGTPKRPREPAVAGCAGTVREESRGGQGPPLEAVTDACRGGGLVLLGPVFRWSSTFELNVRVDRWVGATTMAVLCALLLQHARSNLLLCPACLWQALMLLPFSNSHRGPCTKECQRHHTIRPLGAHIHMHAQGASLSQFPPAAEAESGRTVLSLRASAGPSRAKKKKNQHTLTYCHRKPVELLGLQDCWLLEQAEAGSLPGLQHGGWGGGRTQRCSQRQPADPAHR